MAEQNKQQVEIIQINISGEDKPGLTSSLTEILARYDAMILDIGQANIHQTLSMGILFKTDSERAGDIMKDLLFKAYELGIQVRFKPISSEMYEQWVSMQGKNRYIITVLGRKLTAQQIAAVTGVVAEQGLNIDSILRLTGRVPLKVDARTPKSCIELSVRGNPHDRQGMQSRFMQLSTEMGVDISFQEDNMFRRSRRLICFDMDSTLIETEVIDELAERAGVGDQVRAITESAMRGEIDFQESFTRRVAMLKGLDESVLEDIAAHLPYTGNKVVASVPVRIERAYSVCVQRRVAGAPSVVGILRTFCSAFVIYLYHVAEYIFAEIIFRSVYYHSARAFGVIHILHVFYVVCKKRSVYTRHLFRQDSVSVTRHLSAVYVGVLCSRPVGVRVSLSVPRKNAVAVVKQIHVGKIRVGIFY